MPSTWRKPTAKMNSHTSGRTSAETKRSRWCRKRSASRHTMPFRQVMYSASEKPLRGCVTAVELMAQASRIPLLLRSGA